MLGLKVEIDRLVETLFFATLRLDMGQGTRLSATTTVVWFLSNEQNLRFIILAVFFGAWDHVRHILGRLLSEADDDGV